LKIAWIALSLIIIFTLFCAPQSQLIRGINQNDVYEVRKGISRGANLNELNDVGAYSEMTALQYAILKEADITVIEELIKNGANINIKDNNELTPLMYAANNGHFEAAKLLIKSGANVNSQDNSGQTALMLAAIGSQKNHKNIYNLLIKNKANSKLKDNYGLTASMYEKIRIANEIKTARELQRLKQEQLESESESESENYYDDGYRTGPRGGRYRYSSSGRKVYDSSRRR